MTDEWEENTLSQRHTHNRVGKGGRASKGGGHFDVRQAFGSYKVDCPSYSKLGDKYRSEQPSLELYGFTPERDGLHGILTLPHLLIATVILAGSRKAMNAIIADLDRVQSDDEEHDDTSEEDEEAENVDAVQEEEDDDDADTTSVERPAEHPRSHDFEKNSFRSPKFWLRWQGTIKARDQSTSEGEEQENQREMNTGYIVFSPDVKKFSGTLSCDALEWSNKSITGWKLKSTSERDVQLSWWP